METRLFISYSHKDSKTVISIVRKLALSGYKIWMDAKDIVPGENFILKIAEGVHHSDVYVIFLSKASTDSNYVMAELSYAVKRAIEEPQFKIIPILLENVSIPDVISHLNYINATSITSSIIHQINNTLRKEIINPINKLTLTSVEFTIANNSEVEFDKNDHFDNKDVIDDCNRLLQQLRSKAYGILMNFIPVEEFDLMSEVPQFTNGIYEEHITTVSGSTIFTNSKRVAIKTIVFMPNEEKVGQLLKHDNGLLDFESITFGFSFPLKESESYETIGKRCLAKLRKDHLFFEYSVEHGAKIQLSEDFYLSLAVSNDQIRVTLNSKYDFQLKNKIKDFDVYKYITFLLS